MKRNISAFYSQNKICFMRNLISLSVASHMYQDVDVIVVRLVTIVTPDVCHVAATHMAHQKESVTKDPRSVSAR